MKIDAVSVTSSDVKKTVEFYSLLGFIFPEFEIDIEHLEPVFHAGSTRLMIDTKNIVKNILGEDPKPGNHSSFAIRYDTPQEVDKIAVLVKEKGFTVIKEPWDAFWGQRYAIVQDPDGYRSDLYAKLPENW